MADKNMRILASGTRSRIDFSQTLVTISDCLTELSEAFGSDAREGFGIVGDDILVAGGLPPNSMIAGHASLSLSMRVSTVQLMKSTTGEAAARRE